MLTIKRSSGGLYWHVMYNHVMLECCTTRQQAKDSMAKYKTYAVLP